MDEMHRIFTIILIVLNLAAILLYGWDKFCARQGWRRVPEKVLLLLALLGGSLGAMAAMAAFRHKTQHLVFRFGVPLIFVLQIAVMIYLHRNIGG